MTPDYEDPPEMVLATMPHRQIVRPWDVCWRRVATVPQQDPAHGLVLHCERCWRGRLAEMVMSEDLDSVARPPIVHLDCFAVRMDPDCEYYYWLGQCPRCHTGYWAWREKDC